MEKNKNVIPARFPSENKTAHLFEKLPFAESENEYQSLIKAILKEEPDNLQARLMALEENSPLFLKNLEKVLQDAEESLKKQGLMGKDSIGSYWLILETRPFILAKYELVHAYEERRMKRKAVEQLEEILYLNEMDNLGGRYDLMALYCELEEKEKALSLYNRYEESNALMLLPLIVLSIKLDDELSAKRYYKILQESNKNCRKVFGKKELDIQKWEETVDDEQYSPGSVEEIYMAIDKLEDDFLLLTAEDYYYNWLNQHLQKPKKTSKKK
ncbi:hypothetical protein LZ578_11880 [Jeotgalibaca sp. MA1X17-3]|uniref:hypothetical protein n=1 Tax=Jeotgalibaca sp. MA1X17-3 TaxID=2908211 RepID=UPI001F223F01|nr:hypothetical protein [Jeotgalibaca sp. MA1X17-3]UJF15635.1 hypothetical protein LZ578_11880 [Jeotgalibaca sp. MA1X17-3]